MEQFAFSLRKFFRKVQFFLTPHFRQIIRFLGLPYCYFYLIDWEKCSASRLKVIGDFFYIFFILRYFPDNYFNCHFYELPRNDWKYFFGSGYNPFQKAKLNKFVQPPEYKVLFEDKEVCHQLCQGTGVTVPKLYGVLLPNSPLIEQIQGIVNEFPIDQFLAKPVAGASGIGIFLIENKPSGVKLKQSGRFMDMSEIKLKERFIVQEIVEQHSEISKIYSASVNSIRVLTLWAKDGFPIILSALMRFGVGSSFIDNWSSGGVAIGIDLSTGKLLKIAYDKKGNPYVEHPNTGFTFYGFSLPMWDEVINFSKYVQSQFRYHPMLGLDVAITPNGPVLLEINAFPDIILQEQTAGPLLKSQVNHREFKKYHLFINRHQSNIVFPM